MNSRIIKAYIEMTKSQNQNTPLEKSKTNPKIVSGKIKRCAPKQDNMLTK